MIKKIGLTFVLIIVAFSSPSDAQVQEIYWFDYNENLVLRGNLETSEIDTLSQINSRLPKVMDMVDGELYWVDDFEVYQDPVVFREGFPGDENARELFSLEWDTNVIMMRVDVQNDYVYWLQHNPNSLRSASFDGTDMKEIATSDLGRFRIDHASEKIYWIGRSSGTIRRSNLDGTQAEEIISNEDFRRMGDLEIDTAGSRLYWSVTAVENDTAPGIYRAGLDGGDAELVNESRAELIALDADKNNLYWINVGEKAILRAGLDDGLTDTLITSSSIRVFPNTIMFDPERDKLLWAEGNGGEAGYRIMQADADGGNVEEILPGFGTPVSVVIALEEEKLYWTTGYFREVMKSGLDGFNTEVLVRESVALSTPRKWDIFLDRDAATLYWGYQNGAYLFSQVDVSGQHRRSVSIAGFIGHGLSSMAFDPENGHLYAASYFELSSEPALLRMDANDPEGNEVIILLDEEELGSRITGLGIDLRAGKMYWTEHCHGTIRRANLDGSAVEELITDLSSPSGIAMDVENGKIYWTERSAGTISRANLDGTQVEVLFTNLTNPGRPHFSTENIGVSISSPPETQPVEFSLHQNYPNPFNPVTVIGYQLPASSDVRLEVFDMLGRRVALLVNETQPAGTHSAEFDASNLASGVYLYRLLVGNPDGFRAGNVLQTRQMVLVK